MYNEWGWRRRARGAPFAIVCPGGGFEYVGSLHEGLPLASEFSKKGLNAFVLRYRIGEQVGTEDLAAATAFVFRNAETLEVDTRDYSLWGASAGARLVGNIALRGFSSYGERDLPRPAVVVIAYTGQSTLLERFPTGVHPRKRRRPHRQCRDRRAASSQVEECWSGGRIPPVPACGSWVRARSGHRRRRVDRERNPVLEQPSCAPR